MRLFWPRSRTALSSDLGLIKLAQGTVMRVYRWKIPFQWTIRDWFWMSALCGVSLCWWMDSSNDYRSETWNGLEQHVLNEFGSATERELNQSLSLQDH